MADQPPQNRRHIPFRRENIENRRHKTGRSPKLPDRDRAQHGRALQDVFRVVQRDFENSQVDAPPEFDPAFIFRIRTDTPVDEDNWRRSRLTLLSEEPGNFVVLFSEDQLREFQNRVGNYSQVEREEGVPTYSWIAAVTTEISMWNRNDRIGRKLAKLEIDPEQLYSLDVELWHYGSHADSVSRMGELRLFVDNHQGQFLDSFISSSLSMARVKLNGDALSRLLDVGIVREIDLPPSPDLRIGQMITVPLDDFRNPVPNPPDGAVGICVIDSGIAAGHPFLGPAIGEIVPIPEKLGTGLDEHGHGTMVAGIALYGDVEDCINNLNFVPQFHLFGARVTNAENCFDDERLIISQMNRAIRYFHNNYHCRVFNISLADPELVYDGGKPSQWAHILDSLARELDVVIVVSTGNIPVITHEQDVIERIRARFPAYLLDPDSRILEPATAANVITVGAIAQNERAGIMAQYPDDPAYRCIAETDQPSPFTRSGPGVNNAIKPEVCEYGGNVLYDGRLGRIISDRELCIVSTNREFLNRLFTVDIGTSFAAPKVAHLAGQILHTYSNISGNLVRALIANSACPPDLLIGTLEEEEILRLYGYGRPDPNRALFSTENRVTLIAEDNILLDTFHIYHIPIPEEFQDTRGRRRITISLAYDPPVRHTRKDYLGLRMDFYLIRGMTTDHVIEYYSARPKELEIPGINPRFRCDLTPTKTQRDGGTLQKASFTFRQNQALTNYGGDHFHLVLRCKASNWISPNEIDRQRYGLAVTLEHLEVPISIYDRIQQRVQLQQRVRV